MAAAAGGTTPPPPPLRLKDLLELDCDSCSAAGFRCYPRRLLGESPSAAAPMRLLLESPSSLSLRLRPHRRPSKLSHLSRSLSRRLSSRWSKRRQEEDENAAAAAATAASSAGSSSSSEELETSSSESSSDNSSGRTNRRSRSESDSEFSSATEDSVHHHYPSPAASAAAGDEPHEVVGMERVVSKDKDGSGSEADDKEQLSPVAVMDFPLDDDEEDDELRDAGAACSPPSFSLARLRRRKTHKIRRFESRDDELSPLDLEARLATTSSDPDGSASASAAAVPPQQQQMIQCRTEDASRTPTTCAGSSVHDVPVPDEDDDLISLLMGTVSAGMDDDASERLLLDFFVEMKRRRSEARAEAELPFPAGPAAADGVLRRKAERVVDNGDEAVAAAAARGWLEGTGTERWGLADVLSNGAAILAEMDRDRRWMQVGVEEREVCAVVAGMLADQLVIEVVRGLFV